MKTEYKITLELLKKIADLTDFEKLNKNLVPTTFNYDNKSFVIIGSTSMLEKGFTSVSAHEIVKIENYTGTVKPMREAEHYAEILKNNRQIGYNGRLLQERFQQYVMIDPMVKFYPVDQPKQLEIF